MNDIWENIKAHPWIVGVVLGLAVFFIFLRSPSSDAAMSGTPSAGGADSSLPAMQLQVQGSLAALNAQLMASSAHDQSQIEVARIGADTVNVQQQLEASVYLSDIDAQKAVALAKESTAQQGNTLSAQVAINSNNVQESIARINSFTTVQTNADVQDTLRRNAELTHDTQISLSQISADASTRQAQLYADSSSRAAQLYADTSLRTAQLSADAATHQTDVYANIAMQHDDTLASIQSQYLSVLPGLITAQGFAQAKVAAQARPCSEYFFGMIKSC